MRHPHHNVHRLAITALSPVHIGTGQDLEPTGYVIDGKDLYLFSPEAALRALSASAREELTGLLGDAPSVRMIKQVQAFFHRYSEALIAESEHAMPVLPSIAAEYRTRVGNTAQREESGRDIINQLTISRTFTDQVTQRPILPGSSLKGAMRTALLDLINDGELLPADISSLPQKKQSLALQQSLFHYRDFNLDPMRLVQLGDARDQTPVESYATDVCYAVNRKRQPVFKDGTDIGAQAENLRQVLECVPPLRPQAFTGQLGIQDVDGLTGPKLPDPGLRWTFHELAGACNRFYRPILVREVRELAERGFLSADWMTAVQQILAAKQDELDANRAFLLRVGRHSGAESVTLEGVRSIRINMGKDPRTGRTRYERFPETKTVWLAAGDIAQKTDMLPFGWMLVEGFAADHPVPSWSEPARAAVATRTHADEDWHRRVSERRATLRAAAAERQAREVQRAEQAAQAQREAEAREARRASLSEEERQIEDLREHLDRDRAAGRKEKGGELANRLAPLLKEAEQNWQGDVCIQLADLAEEIHGYIGWPSSKKKQVRREQIEAIRGKG